MFFFLGDEYVLISWKQTDAIVEIVTFRTEVILTHLVTFQTYQVSVGRRRRMGLLGITKNEKEEKKMFLKRNTSGKENG